MQTQFPLSLPRTDDEAFCTDCGLAFGLVPDSPLRMTCGDCWEKLGCPSLACDECKQAIPKGVKFHLKLMRWCSKCARKKTKEEGRSYAPYSCDTAAW